MNYVKTENYCYLILSDEIALKIPSCLKLKFLFDEQMKQPHFVYRFLQKDKTFVLEINKPVFFKNKNWNFFT